MICICFAPAGAKLCEAFDTLNSPGMHCRGCFYAAGGKNKKAVSSLLETEKI